MSHKTNFSADIYFFFECLLVVYLPADQTFRNLSHETLQNWERELKMVFLCTVLGGGQRVGGRGNGV